MNETLPDVTGWPSTVTLPCTGSTVSDSLAQPTISKQSTTWRQTRREKTRRMAHSWEKHRPLLAGAGEAELSSHSAKIRLARHPPRPGVPDRLAPTPDYQSLPRATPSEGLQAATQVVTDIDGVTTRTLPSPMPTTMPPVWPPWVTYQL